MRHAPESRAAKQNNNGKQAASPAGSQVGHQAGTQGISASSDAGATQASTPVGKRAGSQASKSANTLNNKATNPRADAEKKPLRGSPWAFGVSKDRNAALWRKGVPTKRLTERALAGTKAADTSSGIASALESAGGGKVGGLGLTVRDKSSSWRESLPSDTARPDENLPMQSDHVVRAYADVPSGEDLSISVGPELILKGEREHVTNSKRPDSAFGMGMHFKMDF